MKMKIVKFVALISLISCVLTSKNINFLLKINRHKV